MSPDADENFAKGQEDVEKFWVTFQNLIKH